MLTKATILHSKDREVVSVDVPAWGGNVYVKALSLKERAEFEADFFDKEGGYKNASDPNMLLRLVLLCVTNDQGVPLFQPSDLKPLMNKNAAILKELFEVALRLSYQGGLVTVRTPKKEVKEVANEKTE